MAFVFYLSRVFVPSFLPYFKLIKYFLVIHFISSIGFLAIPLGFSMVVLGITICIKLELIVYHFTYNVWTIQQYNAIYHPMLSFVLFLSYILLLHFCGSLKVSVQIFRYCSLQREELNPSPLDCGLSYWLISKLQNVVVLTECDFQY